MSRLKQIERPTTIPEEFNRQGTRHNETSDGAVAELAQAIEDYKKRSGRAFPTWSEVLEILQTLGYEKSQPGDDPPLHQLKICREGLEADAIGRALARFGGVPVPSGKAEVYSFRSESDCQAALLAIQGGYGWTSVERRS